MFSWFKSSRVDSLHISKDEKSLLELALCRGPMLSCLAGMNRHSDAEYYAEPKDLTVTIEDGEHDLLIKNSTSHTGNDGETLYYVLMFSFLKIKAEKKASINIKLEIPSGYEDHVILLLSSTDDVLPKIENIDFNLICNHNKIKTPKIDDVIKNGLKNSNLNFNHQESIKKPKEYIIKKISNQIDFNDFINSYDDADEIHIDFTPLEIDIKNYKSITNPIIKMANNEPLTIKITPEVGYSVHPDLNKVYTFDAWDTFKFKNIKTIISDKNFEFIFHDDDHHKDYWDNCSFDKSIRVFKYCDSYDREERMIKKMYSELDIERILREEAEAKVVLIKQSTNIEINNLNEKIVKLTTRHKDVLKEIEKHEFSISDNEDLCFISAIDVGQDEETKELQKQVTIECLSVLCTLSNESFKNILVKLDMYFNSPPSMNNVITKISSFTETNRLRRTSVLIDSIADISEVMNKKLQPIATIIESLLTIHNNQNN